VLAPAFLPSPLVSIINTFITLLIFAIIIRVILSYFPGVSYQLVRFLDQLTSWLIDPIRRAVPPMGGIDFSPMIAILLLYAIQQFINYGNLIATLIWLIFVILWSLIILLFIRIFLSFFKMDPWNPFVQAIFRVSEPFARPFRTWLPRQQGQFDWAPVAALVVLFILQYLLGAFGPRGFSF
jgi:YggT family protein